MSADITQVDFLPEPRYLPTPPSPGTPRSDAGDGEGTQNWGHQNLFKGFNGLAPNTQDFIDRLNESVSGDGQSLPGGIGPDNIFTALDDLDDSNSQPFLAPGSLITTSNISDQLPVGCGQSDCGRSATAAAKEEAVPVQLIIHPPRNARMPSSPSCKVLCTVGVEGRPDQASASAEHVISSFPSEKITCHVKVSRMWDETICLRFWMANGRDDPNRKLLAETCLPVAKLLEYGIPFVPIWIPFWLGLVPSDWIVPQAVHDKFARQSPHSASHARFLAVFEKAVGLVEDLQEQKICVSINASKFAKKIPPSSASLQKTIVYYNRQIESYHRQIQDEKAPRFGRYMFLEGEGQKNRPSMEPAPRLTGIAESPVRTRQLEAQLTAARIESERLLQECSVETRAAADSFAMVDRLRAETAAERGMREQREHQVTELRQFSGRAQTDARLQIELSEASGRIQCLEAQLASMQAKVDEVSELRRQLEQKERRYDDEREDLQKKLARLEERLEEAAKEKRALLEELASMQDKLHAQRQKTSTSPTPAPRRVAAAFDGMSPPQRSTPTHNDTLSEENRRLREELHEIQREQRRVAFEVAQTREKAADKERDLHQTRQSLSKKNSVVAALNTEKSASDERQENLQIEARQVREEVDEVREAAEHSAAKEVLEEMHVRESALLAEIAAAQAASREMGHEVEAQQAELTALDVKARTEITTLKWTEEALASDLDMSRKDYNARQQDLAVQIEDLEARVASGQAQHEELSSTLDEERRVADSEHRALLRVQMEREEARLAADKLRCERDGIEETLNRDAMQRVNEVARREELRAEIRALEDCGDRLRDDLCCRDSEMQRNSRYLVELESDLALSRKEQLECDDQACELLAEVARLESSVAGGRDQYGELERTLSMRDSDLSAAKTALSKAVQAHEEVERQREAGMEQLENISAEFRRLSSEYQVNCNRHCLLEEKLNSECTAAAELQRVLHNECTTAREDALLQTNLLAQEAAAFDEQRIEATTLRTALRATEADNSDLERDLGKTVMEKQLERTALEQKMERLELDLERRLKAATESDAQSCELMAEIGRLETVVAGSRDQYGELEKTLALEKQLLHTELEQKVARLESDLARHSKEAKDSDAQSCGLIAEIGRLETIVAGGREEYGELETTLTIEKQLLRAELEQKIDRLESALEKHSREAQESDAQSCELIAEIGRLETVVADGRAQYGELERTKNTQNGDLMEAQSALASAKAAYELAEKRQEGENMGMQSLLAEYEVLQSELRSGGDVHEKAIEALQRELDKERLVAREDAVQRAEQLKREAAVLADERKEAASLRTTLFANESGAGELERTLSQLQIQSIAERTELQKKIEALEQHGCDVQQRAECHAARLAMLEIEMDEQNRQECSLNNQLGTLDKTRLLQAMRNAELQEEVEAKERERLLEAKAFDEARSKASDLEAQAAANLRKLRNEQLQLEDELHAKIRETTAEFRKQEARALDESRRNVTNVLLEEHQTQRSTLKRQLDDGAMAASSLRVELGEARRDTERLTDKAKKTRSTSCCCRVRARC